MINQLHWFPLSARVEFKILVLVLKSKLYVAPKYLTDHIRSTLSATSLRPLRSLDWQVLLFRELRPSWPKLDPSHHWALPLEWPLFIYFLNLAV